MLEKQNNKTNKWAKNNSPKRCPLWLDWWLSSYELCCYYRTRTCVWLPVPSTVHSHLELQLQRMQNPLLASTNDMLTCTYHKHAYPWLKNKALKKCCPLYMHPPESIMTYRTQFGSNLIFPLNHQTTQSQLLLNKQFLLSLSFFKFT